MTARLPDGRREIIAWIRDYNPRYPHHVLASHTARPGAWQSSGNRVDRRVPSDGDAGALTRGGRVVRYEPVVKGTRARTQAVQSFTTACYGSPTSITNDAVVTFPFR